MGKRRGISGYRWEAQWDCENEYEKYPSGQGERPSDIACAGPDSSSRALETMIIIEEDDKDVSERATVFGIGFVDVMLRVADYGHWQTASRLVDFLADASFDLTISRRYIGSHADYEEVTPRHKSDLLNDDGFVESCREDEV